MATAVITARKLSGGRRRVVQWVTRTSETTEDSKGDVLHRSRSCMVRSWWIEKVVLDLKVRFEGR